MELGSGILGLEPPVDGDLGRVALGNRGPDFPPQRVFVGEPLPQAGTGQYAELDFGQVQPTAMLGGVVELQPFGNPPRLGRGRSRTRTPLGGCSGCPGPPGPPESPGRLHPPASASAGRNPAWYVVQSPPPAANPPEARRPGTGCGCPLAGTRSPAAGAVPAGRAAGAGSRPATGLRSRQSRPPAAWGHRARRTGPALPPYGPRSRRSPWGCTTLASATA